MAGLSFKLTAVAKDAPGTSQLSGFSPNENLNSRILLPRALKMMDWEQGF